MGVFIDFVFGAPPRLVQLETIALSDHYPITFGPRTKKGAPSR